MNNETQSYLEMRQKLNNVGQGFCLSKWYKVTMHLHSGLNHSCCHSPPHPIPLDQLKKNPSLLHNSEYKKLQRKIMLENGRPQECEYCWKIEDIDNNHISDRYIQSSQESVRDLLEETANLSWKDDVFPRHLEVNFSSTCNLKCSYCMSSLSSSWHNEIKNVGLYQLKNDLNRNHYALNKETISEDKNNPYIDAFWEWLPYAYQNLSTLRITGGEPLLSKNVYKLLDYISDNPNQKLIWSINTNMMIPHEKLVSYTTKVNELLKEKKINHTMTHTSVDSWGQQAEYIRHGLDIQTFSSNIEYHLQQDSQRTIEFMITFCFLSMPNFELLLKKILELRCKYSNKNNQRIDMEITILTSPSHLSALICNDEALDKLIKTLSYMKSQTTDNDFQKFSSLEYKKLERVVHWIERNRYMGSELRMHRQDFLSFINEHDRRRGTSFLKTFPELNSFYEECGKE
jgi:organic radical activating enzyme